MSNWGAGASPSALTWIDMSGVAGGCNVNGRGAGASPSACFLVFLHATQAMATPVKACHEGDEACQMKDMAFRDRGLPGNQGKDPTAMATLHCIGFSRSPSLSGSQEGPRSIVRSH